MRHGLKAVSLLLVAALMVACSTPGPAPVVSREKGSKAAAKPLRSGGYYRVKSGDTLYAIAWRAGLDHRRLAAWNGIRSPYLIHPGQKLRLAPAKRGVKPSAAKRPARKGNVSVKKAKAPASTARKPGSAAKTQTRGRKHPKTSIASRRRLHWQWPTRGRLKERFSKSDRLRQGIKIAGHLGQPIVAAEAGKIVYSGSGLIGYGRLIIIKHNKNFLSAYGYNRRILVREGDRVAKGERIAEMGKAASGKPMLHFEIRREGTPVDPLRLLPGRS